MRTSAVLHKNRRERLTHPCPCGYLGDPTHSCSCSPRDVHRYRSRISGPLMDRIDLHIDVPAVKYRDLADREEAEGSTAIAKRVEQSRELQLERYKGTKIHCNAQMTPRFIKKYCELDASGNRMLELDRQFAQLRGALAEDTGNIGRLEKQIAEAQSVIDSAAARKQAILQKYL